MKITDLWLTHFGKFHSKHISLNPGMNVVEGNNEAGKSTIHSFIFAMLFGLEGSADARLMRDKYKPWEDKGGYCGTMRIEEGSRAYLIERGFSKDKPYVHLTDVASGREIIPAQSKLNDLLGGMTENIYLNTVSIGQMKSVAVDELAGELKEHVNNLGSAGNINISIQGAQDTLSEGRRRLERRLSPADKVNVSELQGMYDTAILELDRNISKYSSVADRIKEGRQKEYTEYSEKQNSHDLLKRRQEELENSRRQITDEIARYEQEKGQIVARAGRKPKYLDENALRAGAKPGMPTIGLISIIMMFFMVAGAALVGVLLYNGDVSKRHAIYAFIAAAVVFVIFLNIFIVGIRIRRKRYNFFRLACDKMAKMGEAKSALSSVEEQLGKCNADLSELDSSEYFAIHEQNEELEKELLKLEYEQQNLVKNIDDISARLQAAKRAKAENDRLKDKIAAYRLAMQKLFEAAEEIENSFGEDMLRDASVYFKEVTHEAYDEIIIGRDHKPMLKRGDRIVDLTSVSRGTIEQAYLCIRLAASECIAKVSMPLLLDDTFAFFDDERTKSALKLLKNSNHQVIIMTCQKREKQLIKA
ncbi:MAG: AAA family ATPase [Lachnospiraceae bacterium]|nr:AAA family ATPase [Lachnospiraceae bacterium]